MGMPDGYMHSWSWVQQRDQIAVAATCMGIASEGYYACI